MAVAFETIGTVSIRNSITSTTIPAPSSIEDNDLLLIGVSFRGDNTIGQPSGFTEVHDIDGDFLQTSISWKLASSESGDYVVTHVGMTGTKERSAFCMRISGVDLTTPFHTSETAARADAAAPYTALTPVATSTVDGCLIIHVLLYRSTGTAGTAAISGVTATEHADLSINSVGLAVYSEDALQTVAGATTAATITTSGGNLVADAYTICIAPLVAAAASGPKGQDMSYQWGW